MKTIISCSTCGNYGHNRRNKLCPARVRDVPLPIINIYKNPTILFNRETNIHYTIFDNNLPPELLYKMFDKDLVRFAYFSHQNKIYSILNKGDKPSNKKYNDPINYTIKIALIIPRPTNAVVHMKSLQFIFTNICVSSQSNECPICYDNFTINQMIRFNCNHLICPSCINGYIHANKTTENQFNCPVCRTFIKQVNIYEPDIYNNLADTLYRL